MRHLSTIYKSEEDLLEIRKEIGSHPPQQILIQVYCGTANEEKVTSLRSRLLKIFPGASIIGASSAGEICNAQVQKNSVVISVSLFDFTRVKTVLIQQNDDLVVAGESMAAALEEDPPEAVIVFGCGLKNGKLTNSLPFLKALHKKLGNVVIAGGQAGEGEVHNDNVFVFTEQGHAEEGFVGAALSGDKLCIHTDYNLGWVPIGKTMTVTRAEGNRLYSIDNIPAARLYTKYLGIEPDPFSVYYINNFPLMTTRGSLQTTNAISVVNQDGSFELVNGVRTGDQVRFSFCDVALQEESSKQLNQILADYAPEAIFVYSCASRMELFGDDVNTDMEALKCCDNTAGFFAFGEYFTQRCKRTYFLQQTMTVLALSESDSCRVSKLDTKTVEFLSPGANSRRFQLLKALSNLVSSTTQELESMNQQLAEQAQKDGLTGLANRRLFDENLLKKIKEHSRSETAMTLVLMDVDFFKQFNDIYGHVAGDACLRGIAQVLNRNVKRNSDLAFRYGGEEFGCLLSFTNHTDALKVAESIRAGVESIKISHEKSLVNQYVTISLGVLTVVNPEYSMSPEKLISVCDDLLYKAKREGRNRVVAQEFGQGDFC